MKETPNVIYLQDVEEKFSEQTAAEDTKYLKAEYAANAVSYRIEAIAAEIKSVNTNTMAGNKKVHRLRGIKKELTDWLLSIQAL